MTFGREGLRGAAKTPRWDYAHHVVPPLTASTTFRLESVKRAARGFNEFGRYREELDGAPVYIYDRLEEPTRGLLESQLAAMEGCDACLPFASGLAAGNDLESLFLELTRGEPGSSREGTFFGLAGATASPADQGPGTLPGGGAG